MDQVLISLWDYLPVSIVLFDVFLLILLRRRMKDKFILRPIFLIPLILLAYPISGTLNLTMIQVLVGWYSGVNPISANRLVFGATAVFLILLLTFKSEGEGRKSVVRFKTSSLMTWIFWGTVIGAIANAVNFYIIGGVPIFWSNLTGSERFEVASRLPVAKFLAFSSAFLTLNIIFLAKGYKPRLLNIMCMIVNTIISVGIGSRQLVLLPLVTAGIYLMFIKRISNRVVLYSIVGLAVFSFFFQVIRGETTVVGSGDSSGTSSAISTVGFLYSLGGEYRDFVLLRDSYHYSNFLYGETILPIFTNIIPKQIFEVFGMDKAAYSGLFRLCGAKYLGS